jgi:hypothetical protein
MAAAVMPELHDWPLYIYSLPTGVLDSGHCRAFTSVSLPNFAMREHLTKTGQWIGPGRHVIFCKEMDPSEVLPTFGHEISHLPTLGTPNACDHVPQSVRTHAMAAAETVFAAVPTERPRWLPFHSASFIRSCLHVGYRACEAGFPISSTDMRFAGPDYELRSPIAYMVALGDEPARLAGKSFAEIAKTPPPSKFRQTFIQDATEWYRARSHRKDEA